MEELNRVAAVRIEASRPDYRAGGQRAPRPVSGERGGGATGARTAATLGPGRHLLFVLFGGGVTNVRDVTS